MVLMMVAAFAALQLFMSKGQSSQKDPRGATGVLQDIKKWAAKDRWRAVRHQTEFVMLRDFAQTPEAPEAMLIEAQSLRKYADSLKTPEGKPDESAKIAEYHNVVRVYRDLEHRYPQSPAWLNSGKPVEKQLITEINRYNANQPPYDIAGIKIPNQYHIVNGLVMLTGGISWFSYAFAMVLLAAVVVAILWPLRIFQFKSMREMMRIQPLMRELQQKYKGEELNRRMMAVYKEHKVNPAAGCFSMLTLFLQLPFLLWVYNAIKSYEFQFAKGTFLWIGSSISHQYPSILASSLGLQDSPLIIIYAATMYVTQRMMVMDPSQADQQKKMALFSTAMFLIFMFNWHLPSAFVLYWISMNLMMTGQQLLYMRPHRGEAPIALPTTAAPNTNGKAMEEITADDETEKPKRQHTVSAKKLKKK